jgi:hypothetical protein
MVTSVERILILAKTYPSPSAKYTETSCVAGINDAGEARRLFPVPFRLISGEQQFKKWQWIRARIEKSPADHRPESHRIFVDTIEAEDVISTGTQWALRRLWIDRLPAFADFAVLDVARQQSGLSLALLRPKRVIRLEITPADNPQWTDEDLAKLLQEQNQGSLFDQEEERKQLKRLEKLPFEFHYHYACNTPDGEQIYRHKVVDWEVGMLYRHCRRSHGDAWEEPFRAKLEAEFMQKDLMFMMGNIHRFQHQWLIISLIYPPKPVPADEVQQPLF